jgi:hypothetical protein
MIAIIDVMKDCTTKIINETDFITDYVAGI